jgi:DHA2 family multidrug resistance protein
VPWGLAAIYTFLNNRSDVHFARLHEALNSAYRPAVEALDALTSRFQSYGYGAGAKSMALKQLFAMAHQEGIVMAFSDLFLGLTLLFVGVALGTIMMRSPTTLLGDRRTPD